MHTPFLVGMLFSVALASLGTTAFYLRAWSGRREHTQYLLFALSMFCWGLLFLFQAVAHRTVADDAAAMSPSTMRIALTVPALLAVPFLLHFAVRQASLGRERVIMSVVYALTAVFVVVTLSGGMWQQAPVTLDTVSLSGLEFHRLLFEPSAVGKVYYFGTLIAMLAVVWLIGRASFREHRRGDAAFYGAVIMVSSLLHDALLGAGVVDNVELLPIGVFALGFGVGLTLVERYARTATALAASTSELEQREAQLDLSYSELKRTQKRLVERQQLAAIGELAAVVAHEVRNPLAVVSNAVASLQKGRVKGAERKLLTGIIDEETARLEKLVSHLLDYTRPVQPNPVELDLRDLLERSMSLLDERPELDRRLDVSRDVPSMSGDPDLLRQAFENVVANAAQAMRNAGSLRVCVTRENLDGVEGVAVDFADDGEGMTDEAQSQALAPFFTTRPTGTGLGLPIVGRIVEAHGGALDILSQPGAGTTIRLHLPSDGGTRLRASPRASLLP